MAVKRVWLNIHIGGQIIEGRLYFTISDKNQINITSALSVTEISCYLNN